MGEALRGEGHCQNIEMRTIYMGPQTYSLVLALTKQMSRLV